MSCEVDVSWNRGPNVFLLMSLASSMGRREVKIRGKGKGTMTVGVERKEVTGLMMNSGCERKVVIIK